MHSKSVTALVVGALAGALGMAIPSAAQQQVRIPSEALQEAQRSLQFLQRLESGAEHFKGLGFRSRDEAKSAVLGEPMRLYRVPLDRLREYQAGADPNGLLVDSNSVIFPLNVGGEHRSSVTVLQQKGKWGIVSLGRPALTKALTETRQRQAAATQVPRDAYFAVHVPALGHHFIAYRSGGNLLLVPLTSEPALGWEEGQAVDAQRAFTALVPEAKALQTGPEIVN
jgi:hypothetical protein